MTTTQARVLEVARSVQRRFIRRRVPADMDDVFQDAALAALEATAGKLLDPRQRVSGYMFRAAKREVGLKVSRALASVYIAENKAGQAKRYRASMTIGQDGRLRSTYALVSSGREEQQPLLHHETAMEARDMDRPDRRLALMEAVRSRARIRASIRRRLDCYLARLPEGQRLGVEALMGRTGPAHETVEDAARAAGVTVSEVRKGVAKLRRLAAGDFALQRLQRRLEEEGHY